MIGGSNNVHKPGGAIVRNIISGGYEGTLRIVNPKQQEEMGTFQVIPDSTNILKYTIMPISEIVDARLQRELRKADTARRLQEYDQKHPRKEAT